MKYRLILPILMLFFLLAGGLSAAPKNLRPFYLPTAVTMNGAEIPSGVYDLSWESEKNAVRVTLWKNGRFFATASGAWVKQGMKFPDNAALLRVNYDGSRSLVEIRLAGAKKSIVLRTTDQVLQVGSK